MATTLTVCVFRHNQMFIGHVGDCRVYLLRGRHLQRITTDHSYVGVQLKLGLITVEDAQASELRSVLTRTVGAEPFIRADSHVIPISAGDVVVICSDGLHAFVNEREMVEMIASTPSADEACKNLVHLAHGRAGDDNVTVQIVQVKGVDDVWYYRGTPIQYTRPPARGAAPAAGTAHAAAGPGEEAKENMPNEVQVGTVLDKRFELIDVIAVSGMATIFKAKDLNDDERVVAVKVPKLQYESDPGFYTRFEREEEIGSRLHHPYILRVEAVPEKSRPYLVMEYLEGQTLGHLMASLRPMPQSDALRIASRICEALIYLHEHDVVHRDLKPDNVMICNDGSIRVMDFGIAKTSGARRLTFGGFQPAMGTPDYMAPEQVKGKRGDARTDIYSLGAILYEMVTGKPPFSGDNPLVIMNARLFGDPVAPRELNASLTPQVEEIVLRAMSRDPSDRFSSVRDFKAALDQPDSVQVTGRAQRLVAPRPIRQRFRALRLVLLGMVIPVIVIVLMLLANRNGRDSSSQPSPTTHPHVGQVHAK